jgi:hypothetical protein
VKRALLLVVLGLTFVASTDGRPPQNGDVTSSIYEVVDPGTGATVVVLHKLRFDAPFGGYCEPLLVAEAAEGRSGSGAKTSVKLGFVANGYDGKPTAARADGVVYDLGRLEPMRFVEGNQCRNLIETFGLEVDSGRFAEIVNARDVELTAGDERLPLTAEHLRVLRLLAARADRAPGRRATPTDRDESR